MIITIIIMITSIVIAELISYKIMNMDNFNLENKTIFFVIIVYIIFGILTYFPLKIDLFKDPTKNIYGIYKRLNGGHKKIYDIHDLLALKIMVDDIKNCYITLGLIHEKYHPINDRFKDYICNPKTNLYRSLHSTVFGPNEKLVQTQIRTFDMDKVASFGLTAHWDINKGDARYTMQEELKKNQKCLNLYQM